MTRPLMRQAKLTDIEAILAVFDDARVRGGILLPPDVAMVENDRLRAELFETIEDKRKSKNIVIALDPEDKNNVLGYVEYGQTSSEEITVSQLYARKNTHHVGKNLLAHVVEFAKYKKANSLSLSSLQPTIGYYTDLGFEFDPEKSTSEETFLRLDISRAEKLSPMQVFQKESATIAGKSFQSEKQAVTPKLSNSFSRAS